MRGEERLAYVATLVEGAWFRAALFPIVRLSGVSGRGSDTATVVREAAGELVELVEAPRRWTRSLAAFLEERAVHVAANSETFPEVVQASVDRARKSVLQGSYANDVFDFCSGQVLPIAALRPRSDVYADAVANAGDLSLETRFAHTLHAGRNAPGGSTEDLIRHLSFIGEERFRIVGLGSRGLDFYIEIESTIRNLCAHFDRRGWSAAREGSLANDLSVVFRLQDSATALLARVKDLFAEYKVERARSE